MTLQSQTGLWVLSMISFVIPASADDQPSMQWGQVPAEHLAMTKYPNDSDATALILFDYGKATFRDDYNIVFKRHTRIKILKKAGFDWATHHIWYYASDGIEKMENIEAHTIIQGADGTITKLPLDTKGMFDEDMGGGTRQVRFTLPGIAEGCVVEWRYTKVANDPVYMPDWDFQTSEPVLWSEFVYTIPRNFAYGGITQGYEKFHIMTSEDGKEAMMLGGSAKMVDVKTVRIALKDVPALREEPYITTLDDYRSRLNLQILSVVWPGGAPKLFLESWQKLIEVYLKHKNFGKQLESFGALRREIDRITQGIEDPVKRLEAIFNFVRSTIGWNEHTARLVRRDLEDVYEEKSGNSAEVNLLLTQMLRDAGLKADPVLISTRSNGKIQKAYPIASQFNYVICSASAGEKDFLLDATDRYRPFHLLPNRALNKVGLVIAPGPEKWVEIVPGGLWKRDIRAAITISEEGSLSGTIRIEFHEYGAASERRKLASSKEADYMKNLLMTETTGLSLDSPSIINKDSISLPLVIEGTVSSSTYCQALNDFIYMNPILVDRTMENPFKNPRRNFPIDYATGAEGTFMLELTLPDGYEVKEMPKDVQYALPQKGGTYSRQSQADGNTFRTTTTFKRSQTYYEPQHYNALRLFYHQMVMTEGGQVVLQKKLPAK